MHRSSTEEKIHTQNCKHAVNTTENVKVVSDTVLDMMNSAFYDKPLILRQAFDIDRAYKIEFIKVVSDTVFDMVNSDCYDKPLIFTGAIRLSLSRLFVTHY